MKKAYALFLIVMMLVAMALVSCKNSVEDSEPMTLTGVWECSYTTGNGLLYQVSIVAGDDESFSFMQTVSISDAQAFRAYVKFTENLSDEEAEVLSYADLLAYIAGLNQSNYGHFIYTDTYIIATTFGAPVVERTFLLTSDGFLYCRETGDYYSKKS